jgi:hypothetical protein
MRRILLYALGVLLFALIAWIAFVSVDEVVPFAALDLTDLRMDGRRAVNVDGSGKDGKDGRVLVSFAWRSHTRGARCTRVDDDLRVGVGGEPARAVRLGGGVWVLGEGLPLPFHKCINQALYEIDRALVPGIVGASLSDSRGKPALISAQDLVALPTLVVSSPQPARAGERATIDVMPDTLAVSRLSSTVQRGTTHASPVDGDGHRMSFAVPTQWTAGDDVVRVASDRPAKVLRCQRAPSCDAFGVPVDDDVRFVVAAP